MSFATSTVEPATKSIEQTRSTAPALTADPVASPIRVFLFLVLALAGGMGVSDWLESSSSVTWTGTLEAETAQIVVSRDAKIEAITVTAGTEVAPGDELFRLDADALHQQLITQSRLARDLELELQQAEAKAAVELAWRFKSVDEELHQTQLKSADLLKEKYLAELGRVAWSEFLSANGDIRTASSSPFATSIFELGLPDEARIRAMLQQEAAHNATEVYTAQVELCETRLKELQKMKATLPEQIRGSLGLPLIEVKLAEARDEVERLETQLDQVRVTSPAYGTVGIYRKQRGDIVEEGDLVVEVLDRAQQYLELRIPSRHLDTFNVGRRLDLTFPGGERYEGVVGPLPPQTERAHETGETRIALRILPRGATWPIVPFGTSVDVIIR